MKNTINPIKRYIRWPAIMGAGLLGVFLTAAPIHKALTAPAAVTLTASVQDQQCQGGDFVNVTLTATLNPARNNVRYSWDFNNDGVFDTAPSPDPTVSRLYPDEANVTAVVKVTKGTNSATDAVSFATIRCGG